MTDIRKSNGVEIASKERTPVVGALLVSALIAVMLLGSSAAQSAGPRPLNQLPLPCGQTWEASTYTKTAKHGGHWPDEDSLDLGQWDSSDTNVSEGEPVLASADGTVLKLLTKSNGSNHLYLDHGGGWLSYYVHLEKLPPLTVGQRVAQGEQIGRVGKTGTKQFHLHYTQVEDGSAVRAAFNEALVNTHAGNPASYETWGNGEKLTSANCSSNTFLQVELSGRYQLIYKPGTGAVKIMRLASDGKGASAVWSSTWSRRWTHFTPFAIGSTSYYFAYKSSTGEVDFDRANTGGVGVKTVGEGTWSKGLTHFLPFALGGKPYFVAYDSLHGGASVNRINSAGNGASIVGSSNWGKGWTHFTPFVQDGVQYFLAYQGGTGAVEINRVTGSGNSVTVTEVWTGKWTTGWSHLVALSHGGSVSLLGYKATTGRATFMRVSAGGKGVQILASSSWSKGWTAFSPFALGDTGHVLTYKVTTGTVAVLKLNQSGSGMSTIWKGSWTTGWA
jgi:hypothetical protein